MKDKVDMQTRPEAYVCESVCGGTESVCAHVLKEGEGKRTREKTSTVDRLVNLCLFLLVIACCIHLSANPAKSVYLGIQSKPVGPQLGW